MGYFNELPNIVYQSPLSHKNSSGDYIVIKNIFRRTKLADYVRSSVTTFNKFVIGDGDRPDTIAESLYNDAGLYSIDMKFQWMQDLILLQKDYTVIQD